MVYCFWKKFFSERGLVMPKVRLGKTEIITDKNGFGALPVQRVPKEDAARLLRRAFDSGITYFDTARGYTDSEEKIGMGLSDVRHHLFIATKTHASTGKELRAHLEQSLRLMKTDYIDVYQFHNPAVLPRPGDGSGLYDAMLEAKREGKIRHIGITNHRLHVAREAIESGLYELLQFPFSYLSGEQEESLVSACKEADMGFVAMKALSGGLITNARAAWAYLNAFPSVLPIWGIQREKELDDFLSCAKNPPVLDEELRRVIDEDKKQLDGEFCRGCGYCLPCPADIDIPLMARMSLLLRRAPVASYVTPEIREKMEKVNDCIGCHHCIRHCPYGLDTPKLLRENYEDYQQFVRELH